MAISDFGRQKLARSLRTQLNHSGERACTREGISRVIIEHHGPLAERIIAKVNDYHGHVHREIGLIPSIAADLPPAVIPEFAKMIGVIKIWEDTTVYCMQNQSLITQSVPPSLGAAQSLSAHRAHESGYTGKGVVMALLDTGIFPHEDFTTPENRILAWNDLLHQEPVPYDDHGHGTHIAGIIAGNGGSSNGKYRGIAPESRLVGIKLLDQDGVGRLSDLLAGLEWCLHHLATLNIKVINLSLGTTAQANYYQDPLCRAATKLVQQGVTICAANFGASNNDAYPTGACEAGTTPELSLYSPGINPLVINVGNFNDQKTLTGEEILRSEYSSPGSVSNLPDLVAPGTEITSLKPGGSYGILSGASVATPLVSGAVALILQKWPGANPERMKLILKKTARDLGVGINLQGAGLLNLERILTAPKKPRKLELPGNIAPEIFKVLLNLIGSKLSQPGNSGPNDNLLSNLFVSLLKNLK